MKPTPAQIVLLLIVVAFGLIMAVDLWLMLNGGLQATVSFSIWDLIHRFPTIAFVCGFFSGHLFWNNFGDKT